MPVQTVTRVRYIELMNEALKQHPEFQDGMRIYLHPEGCIPEHASGIGWTGPFSKSGVFAAAMYSVDKNYCSE